MNKDNPLGGRGKANEDKWAHDEDKKRLEELRKKEKGGKTPDSKEKGGKGKSGKGKSAPAK